MAREFSIDAWAKGDAAEGSRRQISVSIPEQVFCWTRETASAGGGYLYGEAPGLRTLLHDPTILVGSNLNAGYPDAFVRKPDPDDAVPVDVILFGAAFGGVPLDRVGIVTFRNNLNKLLLTPLQPNDPWVIDAVRHKDVTYLDIVKVPESGRAGGADNDRFTYFGYKFEALCTGADPQAMVDCTGEFAVMVQVRLGCHNILMAAETDAWEPPTEALSEEDDNSYVGYVELKTYVVPQTDRAVERHYRSKLPRWWVQSFLAGVPTLVAGGRDSAGVLREIHRYPVTRLPAIAAEAGHPFDAFRLLRFGDAALSWMVAVTTSRPEVHWRFEYMPSRRIIRAEVVPDGHLPKRVAIALASGAAGSEGIDGAVEEGMRDAEGSGEGHGAWEEGEGVGEV